MVRQLPHDGFCKNSRRKKAEGDSRGSSSLTNSRGEIECPGSVRYVSPLRRRLVVSRMHEAVLRRSSQSNRARHPLCKATVNAKPLPESVEPLRAGFRCSGSEKHCFFERLIELRQRQDPSTRLMLRCDVIYEPA